MTATFVVLALSLAPTSSLLSILLLFIVLVCAFGLSGTLQLSPWVTAQSFAYQESCFSMSLQNSLIQVDLGI